MIRNQNGKPKKSVIRRSTPHNPPAPVNKRLKAIEALSAVRKWMEEPVDKWPIQPYCAKQVQAHARGRFGELVGVTLRLLREGEKR